MTVYVRWYGKVLEGELLDGESMGMKQVRIPLDGNHPIALFTPGHVYESRNHPALMEFEPRSVKKETFEIKISPPSDVLPADDRQMIEAFKQANWDHERNHLRIDKLDEFYQLWRMAMTPFGYVEAEAVHESCTPVEQPQIQKPVSKKPSKKMLRSTGKQQFTDSTQLSIFD